MKISFFFLLILYPTYSFSKTSHPLFLSQAGAGGASLQEDFSFLLNPATISLQKKNKGALAYTFKDKKQKAFFSFADIKTKIPLAVSYQREWSQSFKRSETETLFLSSGFKLAPYFGLGASIEKNLKKSVWNGSLGSIIQLGSQFSTGLFLKDVLKRDKQNKRSLSLALYYSWRNFISAKIDVSKNNKKNYIYRGAVESFLKKFLSLRLGMSWFEKDQKGLFSGGIAFQSPKFVLEYSLETNQKMDSYQQGFVVILKI